jgi:anti-sigma factor RsiW
MTARMMEHEEAMNNLVAERYLLGELTENDRDAYEEHLFSCPVCFEQIKAGTEFVGHLRRMGAEKPRDIPVWRKVAHGVFRPATSLAVAALFLCSAGINVYQNALLHRPKAPQVITAAVTLKPESRGEALVVPAFRNGNFTLRLVVPTDDITVLKTRVLDKSGREITSTSTPVLQKDEMQINYDARMFQSGRYLVEVQGINRTTGSTELLRQFPFELQLRD